MQLDLLRAKRAKKGLTQTDMAGLIEKTLTSYSHKELGKVEFTITEMVVITKGLDLSFEEFNAIFFDGQLQFSNS